MRDETAQKQKLFLAALIRTGGNVGRACAESGISTSSHRNWINRKERFPEFAAKYKAAKRKALKVRRQMLRDTIIDRAVRGRPQYLKTKDGGLQSAWWSEETGFVAADDHRYIDHPERFKKRTLIELVPSDSLLILEANRQMPAYRSKQPEQPAPAAGSQKVEVVFRRPGEAYVDRTN